MGYFNREAAQAETDPERIDEDRKLKEPQLAKTVRFVNTALSDRSLKALSPYLTRINPQRLELRFTKVTGIEPGVDLWRSLDLPKLEDLDLSSTPTSLRQLGELKYLDRLQYLRLNYNRLRFDEIAQFIDHAYAAKPGGRMHLYLSHVTMIDRAPLHQSENGVEPAGGRPGR